MNKSYHNKFSIYCLLILLGFIYMGCKQTNNTYKFIHLAGYEGANPLIVYLPETVSQVSGFAYYARDSSIFCIDDNVGILYKFPLYKKKYYNSGLLLIKPILKP